MAEDSGTSVLSSLEWHILPLVPGAGGSNDSRLREADGNRSAPDDGRERGASRGDLERLADDEPLTGRLLSQLPIGIENHAPSTSRARCTILPR